MHGYSESKIEAKAAKRGVEAQAYLEYVTAHQATKNARRKEERKRLRDERNKQR